MLDFSDKERKFHIVFASEDDLYYTDSLMELDIYKYLWLSLRKTHKKVWFISVSDNKKIKIKCFDDKPADNSELKSRKKKKALITVSKDPLEWFFEQSKQNDRQAFVTDKDSFRNLFESDCDISELKNITVVLVLRPKISDLKEVISEDFPLLDPYSEYIRRLRKEKTSDIIFRLRNNYGNDCSFMQAFTREHIRNMLLHIIFNDREKADSTVIAEYMTVYLEYYLNSRSTQWDERELFSGFQDTTIHSICPLYKNIKQALSKDIVWKNLKNRALHLYSLDSSDPENALKLYTDEKELIFRKNTVIYMYPEMNSRKEYFLNCDPERCGIKTDLIPKSIRKYVLEHYDLLHRKAMTAGTADENSIAVYKTGRLIDKLCNIKSETAGNIMYERYFRYLICTAKCMKLIYEKNNDTAEKAIANTERYLKTLNDICENLNNNKISEIMSDADECFCLEKDQKLFDDAVTKCSQMVQINTLKSKPFDISGYKPPEFDQKWKNF